MNDDPPLFSKKRGRPAKSGVERKNTYLGFRVRDGMREKLETSAAARSMSVSEEIERRLDLSLDMAVDPFKTIALRMIVERWKMIDALAGHVGKMEDPLIYARAAEKAVSDAIAISHDPALIKEMTSQKLFEFYTGQQSTDSLVAALSRNDGDLEAASDDVAEGGLGAGIFGAVMAEPTPRPTRRRREKVGG